VTDNRLAERMLEYRAIEGVTDRVTDKEVEILSLLEEDPAYTYTTLSERTSTSRKTISLIIKALKEKGIIERVGSDVKGYWKINI